MHIQGTDPSLQTMMIGEGADKEEPRMNDLARISSIQAFNSCKLISDIEYIRPNRGFPPSIRGMA